MQRTNTKHSERPARVAVYLPPAVVRELEAEQRRVSDATGLSISLSGVAAQAMRRGLQSTANREAA